METPDFRALQTGRPNDRNVLGSWQKKGLLRPDCLHQRYDPEDLHRTLHVVGQNVQAHLGSYVGNRFIRKCVDPIQDFSVPNRWHFNDEALKGYSGETIDAHAGPQLLGITPTVPSGAGRGN